jgi:serine protease Do
MFPGAPSDRLAESLGTGFLIDKGVVVTNHHVVAGATEIRVRTSDGKEYKAQVLGSDPRTDLAVILMDGAPPYPALVLGDSDAVQVGEWVVAIGNALGLSSTVTAGIISAKGRSDVPLQGGVRYADYLQTDASINPGNSGGPLLNLRGEVIGINAAVSREGQGIGFAIPINMAKAIVPQLRTSGKVERSWLGVFVGPVTPEVARASGVPEVTGVLITRVVVGGPADVAGMKVDDVIVAFAGAPVTGVPDLRWRASLGGIGNEVPVRVRRGESELDLVLRLGKNPLD